MSTYAYDYLVFIGRFQPYHSGHHHVATEALKLAKNVIFIIGSSQRPRCIRNPLKDYERIAIIRSAFKEEDQARLIFAPQVDYTYNDDRWIASIQELVQTAIHFDGEEPDASNVGLIGYDKDHTTYYLRKFPQYELVGITPKNELNATDLREVLFFTPERYSEQYYISKNHRDKILETFATLDTMRQEWKIIADYKKQFAGLEYPPIFQTVDSVVTQSGHLLVVTRDAAPGEGLWALPGGFIHEYEKLQDAAIRELREETKLDIPTPALVGSIAKSHTYDDPYRSVRGRTITTAFHFKLNDQFGLPKVKGSDDAREATWVPLSDVKLHRERFFEDHYSIIEHMVGL